MTFRPDVFREALATEALGRDLAHHSTLPSTMDAAHDALAKGAPHGHLVITDAQTEGRGSRGRRWVGASGRHLTFSLVLRDIGIEGLTLAAGLAIARGLGAFTDAPRAIKWPNDVWLGTPPKKVAGILVEARSANVPRNVVIGIGINIAPDSWPTEVPATSLADHGGIMERERVLAGVLRELEASLETLRRAGVQAITREVEGQLLWKDERVRCDDVEGRLLGLAPDGALRLETDEGPRVLRAGLLRRD